MKQGDFGLNLSVKRTRKREFLEERQGVVACSELIARIGHQYPKRKNWPSADAVGDAAMHQWLCGGLN